MFGMFPFMYNNNNYNNREYSYEIDANTGNVLSYEQD